jgi:hypothetical protein
MTVIKSVDERLIDPYIQMRKGFILMNVMKTFSTFYVFFCSIL